MKNYFTISEFSNLRNININSLRYYEKIGLLVPAFVNPRTGYRYYSAKQLIELDTIHLCITLGIPLKQLKQYTAPDGEIDIRRLLEDGKKSAEERIADTRAKLEQIETALRHMDELKDYQTETGVYIRSFPARKLVVSEPFLSVADVRQIEKRAQAIHDYAQNNRLFPSLPAGMLIQYGGCTEPPQHRMFFEITGKPAKHPPILSLPAGSYPCIQTRLDITKDIKEFIINTFGPQQNSTVLVSNIYLEKLSFREKMAEIQVLP